MFLLRSDIWQVKCEFWRDCWDCLKRFALDEFGGCEFCGGWWTNAMMLFRFWRQRCYFLWDFLMNSCSQYENEAFLCGRAQLAIPLKKNRAPPVLNYIGVYSYSSFLRPPQGTPDRAKLHKNKSFDHIFGINLDKIYSDWIKIKNIVMKLQT